MSVVIFPGVRRSVAISEASRINLVDTAIVALEAIERPSEKVCAALVCLRGERVSNLTGEADERTPV